MANICKATEMMDIILIYNEKGILMSTQMIATPEEIAMCFEKFCELQSHLKSWEDFVAQIIVQQKEGYQLIATTENGVREWRVLAIA